MKISCITRRDWVDLKMLETKPGADSGGGGIVTKYLSLRKCCPNIHFTEDFGDEALRPVLLIEPLTIKIKPALAEKIVSGKMEKLQQHKGIKLLWCEEQTVFRWTHKIQKMILPHIDGLLACNQYQHQLLETLPFDLPIYTLYTPIDPEVYYPEEKKRQIVVASKVGLQKNTQAVIDLFQQLPSDIHKVYLGNAEMWGAATYEYDKELEKQLAHTADTYIKSASPLDTAKYIRESLVGVNMSIYDVGSLFFLEAALSGCHFFAWNYHPMFDEYEHVHRFDTLQDGLPKMIECFEKQEPNTPLTDEVAAKHSFKSFKTQLDSVIKNVLKEVFISG